MRIVPRQERFAEMFGSENTSKLIPSATQVTMMMIVMMANLIIDHHHHHHSSSYMHHNHYHCCRAPRRKQVQGSQCSLARAKSASLEYRAALDLRYSNIEFHDSTLSTEYCWYDKKWSPAVMPCPMRSPMRSPKHKLKMRSSLTFPDWFPSIACPWRNPMWRKSFHENSNWFPIVPEECLNVRWNHCQHVNIFSWEQIFLFSRPHHHRYSALLSRRGKITKTYKTVWRWGPDGQNLPTNLANISEQKSKFHSRNANFSHICS